MILRYLYTLFLAVLLVTFVGVGIAAFYKAPKYPEYPIQTEPVKLFPEQTTESAEMRQERVDFEKKSRDFQKENEAYNKNVSTIAIAASLLILVLSVTFLTKILYLSDGLLLGGVFTLIYAVVRGFSAGDEMFRFIVVSVGLAVAVFLGYWKFVRHQTPNKKN